MRAALLTSVVIGAYTSPRVASAQPTSGEAPPTIEEAIKTAAAAGKPLFVEFSTEWCSACKAFAARTLPDARVQKALADVVFVRYDAEASPGLEAAAKYDVSAYPTFLVIDKSGVARVRLARAELGEDGIKRFIDLLGRARIETLDESDIRAKLAAKPSDTTTRLEAAGWYVERKMPRPAIALFASVADDPAASSTIRANAANTAAKLRRRVRWKQELVGERIAAIRRAPDLATPDDLVIATIGSDLPQSEVRRLFSAVFVAKNDADSLNAMVYVALAAGAKDEALAGAIKMTAMRRDAEHLDTLAECHHARGDRPVALQVEDEAIARAYGSPRAPVLVLNRSRFQSGTGDANEVDQLKKRASDLWSRLDGADELVAFVAPPRPRAPRTQDPRMAFMMAQFKLGEAIAKACTKDSGKTELAFARVELDATGHVRASVLLLEPSAPKSLSTCITNELKSAQLPTASRDSKALLRLAFLH